ncbi:DUF711 family protein [Marinigracilibium pacificum]|uniref:DUF711 family protein n=1 Tax=Marinigracilibium pacificum TaxID=2729599 RepID=A0A848ISD7_9BACT|nr:DUF711 family protein [Marinigracilibium pacificum]NMM47363.1 DUF711 family protein [Marinigracilibium pacificum]
MKNTLFILLSLLYLNLFAQYPESGVKIRTITAGINLENIDDTASFYRAIEFLNKAKEKFTLAGYEVQTIRIATQNFHLYELSSINDNIRKLQTLDAIADKNNIEVSIGQLLPPNKYSQEASLMAIKIINNTKKINFSVPISSSETGVMDNSILAASEIILAISQNSDRGNGNFRFTASANVPPGTPFFPAAYHEGSNSFSIGLESPNALKKAIKAGKASINQLDSIKIEFEKTLIPIQDIALDIEETFEGFEYKGMDTSPAPGLDASIGKAIEELSETPFGDPATLRACATITTILKSVNVKKCGYSGLMLPVLEDKVLAQRAMEGKLSVEKLLLYSAVSGTGIDVLPIPGNTPMAKIRGILSDVAALSLKYESKALSVRLFLVPGKEEGYYFYSDNPYLTGCTIMKID